MSGKAERATIQERVGRALNSTGMRMEGRSPNAETPLQHVAALGAAALHVHHGADRRHVPVATVVAQGRAPDPLDVLTAELATLLWHIKFADQRGFIPQATRLFAGYLGYRARFNFIPPEERPGLLHALAVRCLHEWLSDRCIACGGSGKKEKSRSGQWVKPRGAFQRNATFRTCDACNGSRRQAVSHAQRVSALGLTRDRYDSEAWYAHVNAGLAWLSRFISPRLNAAVRTQLLDSRRK